MGWLPDLDLTSERYLSVHSLFLPRESLAPHCSAASAPSRAPAATVGTMDMAMETQYDGRYLRE